MQQINLDQARRFGIRLNNLGQIHDSLTFETSISIGSCAIFGECRIGAFSYVNGLTSEIWSTQIGRFCSIAPQVTIGASEHPLDFISTHPFIYRGTGHLRDDPTYRQLEGTQRNAGNARTTRVGNDVWIGQNALIRRGCTIGDGAVVAGGAVVVKDIGPYEVWGGNPARLIRRRFPEPLARALQETEWWRFDISPLKALYAAPERFVEQFEQLRGAGQIAPIAVTGRTLRREAGRIYIDTELEAACRRRAHSWTSSSAPPVKVSVTNER